MRWRSLIAVVGLLSILNLTYAVGTAPKMIVQMDAFSYRVKLWGIFVENLTINGKDSYWTAFKVSLDPHWEYHKIETFYFMILNANSGDEKSSGDVWIEVYLSTGCSTDVSCGGPTFKSAQVFALTPTGIASSVMDFGPTIRQGDLYRIEVRNTGNFPISIGSIEYLLLGCQQSGVASCSS
jgi:hypothetical protein